MTTATRDRAPQWTLVAILLSALLALAWHLLWMQPTREAITESTQNIDALQRSLQSALRAQAELPRVREEILRLETERGIFLAGLPREADVASVIDDLQVSANRAGVNLNSFSQGRMRAQSTQVWAIPFTATVEGTFAEVLAFIAALEGLARYTKLEQVNLSAQNAQSSNPPITTNLGWTVYALSSAAVAP